MAQIGGFGPPVVGGTAMATGGGRMSKSQLVARWQDIARAAAGATPISVPCAGELFQLFEDGAERIAQGGQLGDVTALRNAEESAWKLVRAMLREAEAIGVDHLQELTLRAVKRSLCPIFPFC